MKRMTIVGLIVVAAVAGIILFGKHDKSTDKTSTTINVSPTAKGKTACELLTLADAKSLLGDSAALIEGSGDTTNATGESVKVDNCSYSVSGATLGDLKQLTLSNHFGDESQVKQGYDNYKKTYPGEDLTEFGDMAYFATEAKQVNVLKGKYWLFVAGGSINSDEKANKELEIQAMRLVLKKL